MTELEQLKAYAEDFQQAVLSRAEDDESARFREEEFTGYVGEILTEAGEIDDIEVCHFQSRGMKANGYSFNGDLNRLDVFVSVYKGAAPPEKIGKNEIDQAFRQAIGFVKKSLKGYHAELEESAPAFDMAITIFNLKDVIASVRVFVLTDGVVGAFEAKRGEIDGIPASLQLWDLLRLFRFQTSGKEHEPIEINFVEGFGKAIPCLSVTTDFNDYSAFLIMFEGTVLSAIYGEFGARLLEQNVRTFLQARGNVNKGIRKSILEEPRRFLAYNNGITLTADSVMLTKMLDGSLGIERLTNLQIVNGAQTTASLYHAQIRDKADLAGIHVAAKLIVIASENSEISVPVISKYANSQNKVNDADFSANDPFHVRLESLSRTVWAPASERLNYQSKWFYERARGQYLDAKTRESTAARKRQFVVQHPMGQKYTKTDLAKYLHSWDMLPHLVSLGAQKNFRELTLNPPKVQIEDMDAGFFHEVVAKAILFRQAEKIISAERFGGYRANIVTYTVAYLCFINQQKINLADIWRKQSLPPELQETIIRISHEVWKVITNPPRGGNVTEWCKKVDCWNAVKNINPEPFRKPLASRDTE